MKISKKDQGSPFTDRAVSDLLLIDRVSILTKLKSMIYYQCGDIFYFLLTENLSRQHRSQTQTHMHTQTHTHTYIHTDTHITKWSWIRILLLLKV